MSDNNFNLETGLQEVVLEEQAEVLEAPPQRKGLLFFTTESLSKRVLTLSLDFSAHSNIEQKLSLAFALKEIKYQKISTNVLKVEILVTTKNLRSHGLIARTQSIKPISNYGYCDPPDIREEIAAMVSKRVREGAFDLIRDDAWAGLGWAYIIQAHRFGCKPRRAVLQL
uniref:Uncharacterized protein n=1 Tax=Cannabis sativa TaxID=3483 RepID=A0A803NN39_CANSA